MLIDQSSLCQKSGCPALVGCVFLCKNGKSSGIQSKPAFGVVVSNKSKKCSIIRVNLGRPSGEYCRVRLRKRRVTKPNKK